ncbi:MAG TPA: nucleotidyltransferase domain-containing protein, partial [Chloroflexota bacterium]|nr:nucleotidyltransferase domain-containing protein [Chloroflexota bacterium]
MVQSARSPIDLSPRWVDEFCKRHRICWLALFGSVLRPDFGSTSDVDVLIKFEPGAQVGFIDLASME